MPPAALSGQQIQREHHRDKGERDAEHLVDQVKVVDPGIRRVKRGALVFDRGGRRVALK